jgi:hypothetical protein
MRRRTLRHAKNLVDFRLMNTSDFLAAALRNPVNEAIAGELFRQALPDAWIVSGCLVQTVWNVLTARPVDYGIDDYDIFYFDPDTSWRAEDAVIGKLQDSPATRGVKIEVRNQARVHLWYPQKHGLPLPRAAIVDGGYRPLPDQKHPDRNPPRARRLRRLYAERFRRYRPHDRPAESRAEFFRGKLRCKDRAMEKLVAGNHSVAC